MVTTNTRSAAYPRSEDHHLSCKGLIENTLGIMLRVGPAHVSSAVLAIPTTAPFWMRTCSWAVCDVHMVARAPPIRQCMLGLCWDGWLGGVSHACYGTGL